MKKYIFWGIVSVLLVGCASSNIIGYAYTEGTMMGSTKMTITADSLKFLRYKEGQRSDEAHLSNGEDWTLIHKMGKHIDYKGIDTLTSPTMGRATDAAPFAMLEIMTKDSVYQSASFDGGSPPASIAALVLQLRKISMGATSKP